MTDRETIARVVRSLTTAQRRAILWCGDGWKDHDRSAPRMVSFYVLKEVRKGNPRAEIATVFSLVDVDFPRIENGKWCPDRVALTPLGLEVRKALTAQPEEPQP